MGSVTDTPPRLVGPLPGGCPREPQGHLSSALPGGQTLASPPSFRASVSVPVYQALNNRPAYLPRPVIREYKGKHWDIARHCTPDQCLTSVTSVSSLIDWRLKFPPPHVSLGVNVLTPRRVFLSRKMLVIRTATPLSSETAVSGLGGKGPGCCGSSRTSSTGGPCSGPWRLGIKSSGSLCFWLAQNRASGALPGLGQGPSPPEASQALARACSSSSQHLARPSQSRALVPRFEVTHAQRPFAKAPHLAAYSCLSGGCVPLTSQRPVSGLPRVLGSSDL